jgi:hypothetical protein
LITADAIRYGATARKFNGLEVSHKGITMKLEQYKIDDTCGISDNDAPRTMAQSILSIIFWIALLSIGFGIMLFDV